MLAAHGCGDTTSSQSGPRGGAPEAGGAVASGGTGTGGATTSDASTTDGGGIGAAPSGDAGAPATDAADGGCYRDPYLPDNYEPPCAQPDAAASCSDGWCTIEPGCFIMGSPWCEWGRARDSQTPVQVTLTHRFRMQQLELTQAEWKALGLPNPSSHLEDGTGDCLDDACPVGNVNWWESLAFANRLSAAQGLPECYQLTGCTGELGAGLVCTTVRTTPASMYECAGYRLPSAAEWEYAARAGTKTTVYTGDVVQRAPEYTCIDDPVLAPIAWYCANAGPYTHPGGQKQPNAWGLHDMIGNVQEWVASLHGVYGGGPYVDWNAELDVAEPDAIQLRGGAWNLWPQAMRAAQELPYSAFTRGPGFGFRLVQTLP